MRTGVYGIHKVEICDDPGDGTMMIRSLTGENIGENYFDGEYRPSKSIIVSVDQVEEDLTYEHQALDQDYQDDYHTADVVRWGM